MTNRKSAGAGGPDAVRSGMNNDDRPPNDSPEGSDDMSDAEKLTALEKLRAQHRHLDASIKALYELGVTDALKIARMKKSKLKIKDRIAALEDDITPDIIA